MEYVLYVICFLLLVRYGFVLYKYLKTGEFRKKAFKGNIVGIIAYSCLIVLIICFLLLMALSSKDKSSDLLMWITFIAGIGTVVAYPAFWLTKASYKERAKNIQTIEKMNEAFDSKYGSAEYDEFKVSHFDIADNVQCDERFIYLISLITNNQISFVHKEQYKNAADVFADLYKQDYITFLYGTESIDLMCEKVNSLLKKNNKDLVINPADITKDDDEFIKARRRDLVPTMVYDLYKIDNIIKSKLDDYELVAFKMYSVNGISRYPTYLCVIEKSKYEKFFNDMKNEMEANNHEQ